MCMKNVNATLMFCSSIENNENNTISLIGIYDSIVPIRENGIYYLDNFNIALNCCILFDEKFRDKKDCIILDESYELMIWLTHVESGLGIPLYKIDLHVIQENLKTWCKNFYELKRFIHFNKFEIPKGLGNYAVKILIKNKTEESWNTQVIHSLVIGESR